MPDPPPSPGFRCYAVVSGMVGGRGGGGRRTVIAALDTGMRRGEMRVLRFGDIDWKRG